VSGKARGTRRASEARDLRIITACIYSRFRLNNRSIQHAATHRLLSPPLPARLALEYQFGGPAGLLLPEQFFIPFTVSLRTRDPLATASFPLVLYTPPYGLFSSIVVV
jgi:hypothetical protein